MANKSPSFLGISNPAKNILEIQAILQQAAHLLTTISRFTPIEWNLLRCLTHPLQQYEKNTKKQKKTLPNS